MKTLQQSRSKIPFVMLRKGIALLSLLFAFSVVGVVFAAPNLILSIRANKTDIEPGEEIIFTIRYRCASLTEHCLNAEIENVLPSNFDIAGYSGTGGLVGSASESGGAVTWGLQTANSPAGQLDAGSTGILFIKGSFPACDPSGATSGAYSLAGTFSADGSADALDSVNFNLSTDVPTCPAEVSAPSALSKNVMEGELSVNSAMGYDLDFPSHGSTYIVTDTIPASMIVTSVEVNSTIFSDVEIECANSGNYYSILASINDTTMNWIGELPAGAAECVLVSDFYGYQGYMFNVTSVRYSVNSGVSGDAHLNGYFLDSNPFLNSELPNWAAPVAGGIVQNCLVSSDVAVGTSCSNFNVDAEGPKPSVYKNAVGYPDPSSIDGDNMANFPEGLPVWYPSAATFRTYFNDPNAFPPRTQGPSDLSYIIRVAADRGGVHWENPVVVDLLDPNLEWAPYPEGNSWWFVHATEDPWFAPYNPADDPDCSNPQFTVEEDFNGTGRTLLRWEFDGCTLGSARTYEAPLYIAVNTRIKAGVTGGTVIQNMPISPEAAMNSTSECGWGAGHTASQQAYWPPDTDTVDFDGDGDTSELLCKGPVDLFTVPIVADMESSKWVQGILDSEQSRYPLAGSTNLTGTGTYELFIHNTGNTSITQIDVVDILPHAGDTDVLGVVGTRNSAWAMDLSGPVVIERSPDKVTWTAVPTSDLNTVGAMYASSTNPCRFDGSGNLDANGSTPASCTALSNGTAAAGATSFGFSFQPATPFEADEWLRITVAVGILGNPPGCDDPLCDGDTLDTDAIAWNSFAFGGVYDDSASGSRFLDSEPIQVGLKMIDTSTQTSLGNYIWYDENNDGLQGAYETPLAGVTVSLYESDGITLIEKTLTSSDGFYRFNGLTPSSIYVIKLDNPDDFTSGALSGMTLTTQDVNGNANDSIDSDGSYVGTTPVITATVGVVTGVDVLTDPSEYPTNDFGFWLPASIGDTVWFDDDGFGDQTPGEGGVSGVTVNLYYPDGTLAGSTTTDADGEYAFTNLVPGYYYVDIDETTLPANYKFTTQDGTGDDTNDSDADSTGQMALTLLDPGENDPSWDAGITPLPTNPAEIGNKVWLDIDKDGIQDGGEPGVTGVTVQLVDNNGLLVSATTTDSNGEYMFTGLEPSDYKVIILPPAGYSMTTKDASGSTDANDSDADPLTGEMDLTLLDPGESDPDWDAGLISSLDWGDLPDTDVSGSYPTNNANLGEGVGASHVVYGNSDDGTPDGSGAIWLGATVDTEGNGQPNAGASNDGSDEDGVQTNLADWDNGTNGGQVDVTVTGGTGYLVGWFDLNGDGVFDTVAHQSVLAGSNSVNVDIPDGTFSPDGTLGGSNINVFARFRLFENEAAALLMADGTIDETHGYTGIASNGEVEDYMWTFSPTSVSMKQVSSNSDSGSFTLVWVAVGLMLLTGWVYWRKQRSPSV